MCSCAKILLKMHISNKINLKTKFGALITFACGVVCWRGCVFHACECPRCVCRASTRCLKKWQPPTFLLCLSPEIHHVTSWSTCSAHILPEKAFQVWLPWSGCIVCLLHNLSAGKMPLTHTHTQTHAAFNSVHIPEVVCLLGSMYPLADFSVVYGEGSQTTMDLHAFWTGPCANREKT